MWSVRFPGAGAMKLTSKEQRSRCLFECSLDALVAARLGYFQHPPETNFLLKVAKIFCIFRPYFILYK